MNKTNFAKFIKAIAVAAVLGVFVNTDAMAQKKIINGDEAVVAGKTTGDYETVKNKLAAFVAKVRESSKDDAAVLFEQAKAIKEDIENANVTDEERASLKKNFNAVIDIIKTLLSN